MGLITIDELQAHLQRKTAFSDEIQASALAAIEDASGIIEGYRNLASYNWTDVTCPAGVKAVVKRVAGRIFTNPDQRTSYTGPDGLNFSGGPVRMLTDDEREQLDPFDPRRSHVGMIRMVPAPWSVPDTTTPVA